MSASLIGFIPLVLLGLVGTLCFVGCAAGYDFGKYSYQSAYQGKVSTDPAIVAFWPLNDAAPDDTTDLSIAADVAVHPPPPFNGTYKDGFTLQQPGIVPLDVQSDGQTPNLCASFNTGRV